jgi:hypothetical protein
MWTNRSNSGKAGLLAKGKSEQANLASNPYRIPISWQKQALGPDDFGGVRRSGNFLT